jgi:hypothetical protein
MHVGINIDIKMWKATKLYFVEATMLNIAGPSRQEATTS